jgi:hypothetical protein
VERHPAPEEHGIGVLAGESVPELEEVKQAVKIGSPLEIGLAAGAVVVLTSAGVFAYFRLRRKKDPAEIERFRRLWLGRTGRITTGEVTGLVEPEGNNTALLLVYRYDIAGVTYEVMQDLSTMSTLAAAARRLVGKRISVKYDMKHPSNSIAACEVWSGLSGITFGEPDRDRALSSSSAPTSEF